MIDARGVGSAKPPRVHGKEGECKPSFVRKEKRERDVAAVNKPPCLEKVIPRFKPLAYDDDLVG